MKKVMLVFGTRPEAIKMCPLVRELKGRGGLETVVCVTGQHKEMLSQVLEAFDVKPDYDLSIMQRSQTLYDITQRVLERMEPVLKAEKPDVVLVHGDTTTAFASALACFYQLIPVGHVEAGLRTHNIHSPYPEEFNRQAVGLVARYHFAPTDKARQNLLAENKDDARIYVTGNTAIDALNTTVRSDYAHPYLSWARGSRLILLTAHRRENLGGPLKSIFAAVNRVVREFDDIKVLYPVHMNPAVRQAASDAFGSNARVKLVEPLDVLGFHNFMARSYLVLTDSGGLQEEAPALGKPVLVLRDTTERPEGVTAGTLKLVGTDEERIYGEFKTLLSDARAYEHMSLAANPYGDGFASRRIADILEKEL
ncbi:MAG: UDP-N-acetylglucosamine 2-epimerase (non-hydrolyzing) [Eubacteriales bacterium]|nr:UDP-N-acetylglucosamine 2-epimerase (non-hydrolyzing) [Eubacteriales bacterium]